MITGTLASAAMRNNRNNRFVLLLESMQPACLKCPKESLLYTALRQNKSSFFQIYSEALLAAKQMKKCFTALILIKY